MQEGVRSDSRCARRKLISRKEGSDDRSEARYVEDVVGPNLQPPLCGLSLWIAPVLSAASLSGVAFGFYGCDKLRR